MESKFQRWWLYACFAAVLLAGWAGGFSVIVTAVFIVIYLTGVALIGPDGADHDDAGPGPEHDEARAEENVEDAAV